MTLGAWEMSGITVTIVQEVLSLDKSDGEGDAKGAIGLHYEGEGVQSVVDLYGTSSGTWGIPPPSPQMLHENGVRVHNTGPCRSRCPPSSSILGSMSSTIRNAVHNWNGNGEVKRLGRW